MKAGKIILIVISIIILSALALTLFCMHKTQQKITLPDPTGPFAAGTTSYHLIDKSRKEEKAPNPQDYRELMIQVWYPVDKK